MTLTSKQRAYLKSLASTLTPVFQVGKAKPDTRSYKGGGRGVSHERTDENYGIEKLYGRSAGNRIHTGRKNTCNSCPVIGKKSFSTGRTKITRRSTCPYKKEYEKISHKKSVYWEVHSIPSTVVISIWPIKRWKRQKLDQILFIPSGVSYMKNLNEILPAEERMEMVRLAIMQYPAFAVSSIETDKKSNSILMKPFWRCKTNSQRQNSFFLTGADTIFSMEEWKDPARYFSVCLRSGSLQTRHISGRTAKTDFLSAN